MAPDRFSIPTLIHDFVNEFFNFIVADKFEYGVQIQMEYK